MGEDLDDLIPLFVSEARDRLERLTALAEGVERDPELAIQARRQLHALKGAANMMQQRDMASLCHEAEELLDPPSPGTVGRLLGLLDQVVNRIEGIAGGPDCPGNGSSPTAPAVDAPALPDAGHEPLSALSRAPDLDMLADRGALLRLATLNTGSIAERVFALAQAAERGSNEARPDQVLATLATSLRQVAGELDSNQRSLQHLARQQLGQLLRLQLQPLRPFLNGLARHARELARTLGREVHVRVSTRDTRLDRRIVGTLRESFLHLVRNAVDHGIESPQERRDAGKQVHGWVDLNARAEGDRVRITVQDDGRGIDPEAVRARAVECGLLGVREAQALDEDDVTRLLCVPGFTTRDTASEVSGRGVGLDAVTSVVRSVGGDLWIESEVGKGTTITVDLPLARRGERVLVLEVGRSRVALPSLVVRRFETAPPDGQMEDEGLPPVCDLAVALGEQPGRERVLIEGVVGGAERAVVVDRVIGEEEVLIRPFPAAAGRFPMFDGMALLASGRPVPVLSPQALAEIDLQSRSLDHRLETPRVLRLLLVEDSEVTREMLRRLLEDAGIEVTTAASGERALERLAEQAFDCVVTDIEMPGLDGLELTRRVRAERDLAHLPIVVVSNLDRPRDRLAGLEAGADAYLSKRGLEARELVAVIRRVGGFV